MSRVSKRTIRGQALPTPEQKAVRSQKGPRVAAKVRPPKDPTLCDGCGALYSRKQWRGGARLTRPLLEKVSWGRCPACNQSRTGVGYGRVVLSGGFVGENLEALRRRIKNVAERAKYTQTQRRLLTIEETDDGLDVITTSQKLAHRIVREIEKAFGGKARYSWDADDGSLLATWKKA
jgi:NMD protein affecting ribosome stability and mRNA decay